MLIYLITFLLVEIFAINISTKNNSATTKKLPLQPIIIILLLSILGGMRNNVIGTDVLVYGERWFDIACISNSFTEYINRINTSDTGYLFINYVVSRFTNNFNIFLFIHQLICNSLVISTLYKYRGKSPFWLSTLCYICLFYCRTYNILRQAVALSIIFYSIRYLQEKKYKTFIFSTIFASFFHFTAIFGITLLPLKIISDSKSKLKKLYLLFIILITILISISIKSVIVFLYTNGIVNQRIYNYLFDFVNETGNIINVETIFKTIFLTAIIIFGKKLKNIESINLFLILTLIMEFILFQIRTQIIYADRISFYFGYLIMLILPTVPKVIREPKNKLLTYILIISFLILYWYYKYIYSGSCEVYPYKFYWSN